MADCLSCHPSDYEDWNVKSEEMFDSWLVIIVLKKIAPTMQKSGFCFYTNQNKEQDNRERKAKENVVTVNAPK